MALKKPFKKLQAYLILDETVGPWKKYAKPIQMQVERDNAHNHYPSEVQIERIPMPTVLATNAEHSRLSANNQRRYDLGTALKSVYNRHLQSQPDVRVEVFIVLQNWPGGDWRQYLTALATLKAFNVHMVQLAGNTRLPQDDLLFLVSQNVNLNIGITQDQLMKYILDELNKNMEPINGAPTEQPESGEGTEAPQPEKAPPASEFSSPAALPAAKKPPTEEAPPMITPPKAEEPSAGKDGVASIWKDLQPADDLGDRYPDQATQSPLDGPPPWRLTAASRRGKMHAHKGSFREDAFALGAASGWNFMVVADGGGSRPLARVGSNLVANTAIESMRQDAHRYEQSGLPIERACRDILENAVHLACEALKKEAAQRETKIDDFGTTFLAVAHRPSGDSHILGALQIGDGLIAGQFSNQLTEILADPDVGEAASQTLFLTGRPWHDWIGRIKVYRMEIEPVMIACMCDGVSDDLVPYSRNLPTLFERLNEISRDGAPEKKLLDFLGYEKRGSFDDRTLALIYQDQPMQD